MKILVLLFISTLLMADNPGRLRGAAGLEQVIGERVFANSNEFHLYNYAGDTSLLSLLGTHVNSAFINSSPNATNSLIWNMISGLFAEHLLLECIGTVSPALNAPYKAALKKVCAWPAVDRRDLENLWLLTMDYDAPESERELWIDFVMSEYKTAPAQAAVKAMLTTMLTNPYFLIQR